MNLLMCGGSYFLFCIFLVSEGTEMSCYFRFHVMNLGFVRSAFWRQFHHIFEKHMIIAHMQSLLKEKNVVTIWIHLHARNRLHFERYLALLTTNSLGRT